MKSISPLILVGLAVLIGIVAAVAMAEVNGGSIETSCSTCSPIPDATFSSYVHSSNLTGTCHGDNTGDQTITLTGDVTGSGTGSFTATIPAGTINGADLASNISINTSGTVTASNFSGTNTGDQTITLSGAVTGTGTGAITTTVDTLKLPVVTSLPTCDGTTEGTLKFYQNAGGKKTLCVCGYEGLISSAYGWFVTTPNGSCS